MKTRSRTPGICRIDQPEKHNHGFFVRLQRQGKIHSAFFTDFKHGGRAQALAAAQQYHRKLLAKLGPPKRMLRRWWAEMGLTPMVPKRLFLPIPLFNVAVMLAGFPFTIYCFGWLHQAVWGISVVQVIVGLGVLYWAQGGLSFRWPLVPVDQIGGPEL